MDGRDVLMQVALLPMSVYGLRSVCTRHMSKNSTIVIFDLWASNHNSIKEVDIVYSMWPRITRQEVPVLPLPETAHQRRSFAGMHELITLGEALKHTFASDLAHSQ